LEINIHEGYYLTNLALRGNYLHVQTREAEIDMEEIFRSHTIARVLMPRDRVVLSDVRMPRHHQWEPTLSIEEQIALRYEMIAFQEQFTRINSVDLSIINTATNRPVDGRRYTEVVYRLSSPDVLEHIKFVVHSTRMGVDMPLSLTVPSFTVPILTQVKSFEGEGRILLENGTPVTVRNVIVSPVEARFDVSGHNINMGMMDMDAFEIYFIDNEGGETRWSGFMSGIGHLDWQTSANDFTVVMSGDVIDVNAVNAIRINGVTI